MTKMHREGVAYFVARLEYAPIRGFDELYVAMRKPLQFSRRSRMPFGIKTASHIFQRAIEVLLGRMDNILIYQDDMSGSPHHSGIKE